MTEQSDILNWIYEVVSEMNETEFSDNHLIPSPETPLFGKRGRLDSIQLVSLVLALEDKVEESAGVRISLADDRAMSQERSPFQTIQTLVEYVQLLLKEQPR